MHPILGELVADLEYKRVYRTSIASLIKVPVWEKQRILRPERALAIAEAKLKKKVMEGRGVCVRFWCVFRVFFFHCYRKVDYSVHELKERNTSWGSVAAGIMSNNNKKNSNNDDSLQQVAECIISNNNNNMLATKKPDQVRHLFPVMHTCSRPVQFYVFWCATISLFYEALFFQRLR